MIENWMNEQAKRIKSIYQLRILTLIFLIVFSVVAWIVLLYVDIAYRGWFTSTIFLFLSICAIHLYHLINQRNHRINRLENFILKMSNHYESPQSFYQEVLEPILILDTDNNCWLMITKTMLFYFCKHDTIIPMEQIHRIVYHQKKDVHLYTLYNQKKRKLKTIQITIENSHRQMSKIMKLINSENS